MMRVLAAVLLLGIASAQGQAYLTRAELKEPLSEAVEKHLAEFVEKCVVEKRKQLTAHMDEEIAAVDAVAKLTGEEKRALEEPARTAVEASVEGWRLHGTVALRAYLNRTSEVAAMRQVGQWKADDVGLNEPVEDWKSPLEGAVWGAALKKTLGDERFKAWRKADAKKRKETEKEIQGYLERWVLESRGPLNEDLETKIEQMKAKMDLDEEREVALKKAAGGLLDEITAEERKRAFGMLWPMPPKSRQNIMGRSYFYIRFYRPRPWQV